MRTDSFFYTPLHCSLYDKDIGYISGKKSCCQFHKLSYRSSSGFTSVRHKCSASAILILFSLVSFGMQISCYSFPCAVTKTLGLLCCALRNTGLDVQMCMVEAWSWETPELVDCEAVTREWYSGISWQSLQASFEKYHSIALRSAEPHRKVICDLESVTELS